MPPHPESHGRCEPAAQAKSRTRLRRAAPRRRFAPSPGDRPEAGPRAGLVGLSDRQLAAMSSMAQTVPTYVCFRA
jgi:hypothetical protein